MFEFFFENNCKHVWSKLVRIVVTSHTVNMVHSESIAIFLLMKKYGTGNNHKNLNWLFEVFHNELNRNFLNIEKN